MQETQVGECDDDTLLLTYDDSVRVRECVGDVGDGIGPFGGG